MRQDLDPNRLATPTGETTEVIQEIWLTNELIQCVKEVAHNIDERVQHVLEKSESQAQ